MLVGLAIEADPTNSTVIGSSPEPRVPIPRQLSLCPMRVFPVGEDALDCSPCSDEALSGTNPDDHDGQRKGDANRATNRQRERR
jgi:hypothetical protein